LTGRRRRPRGGRPARCVEQALAARLGSRTGQGLCRSRPPGRRAHPPTPLHGGALGPGRYDTTRGSAQDRSPLAPHDRALRFACPLLPQTTCPGRERIFDRGAPPPPLRATDQAAASDHAWTRSSPALVGAGFTPPDADFPWVLKAPREYVTNHLILESLGSIQMPRVESDCRLVVETGSFRCERSRPRTSS
jgi:hypothetical protein